MGLFRRSPPPPPPPSTIVAPDTILKGELSTQQDVELSGRFEGAVDCRGALRMGRSSVLEGRVRCGALHCSGTLKAEASVAGTAMVTSDGALVGTLTAKALRIERGARVEGTICQKTATP